MKSSFLVEMMPMILWTSESILPFQSSASGSTAQHQNTYNHGG
jgi:hypothetical protein